VVKVAARLYPEKPKVDETLESFKRKIKQLYNKNETFELKEGKSALKQFVRSTRSREKPATTLNHFFEKLNHTS